MKRFRRMLCRIGLHEASIYIGRGRMGCTCCWEAER